MADTGRVMGIGGIFITAKDMDATKEWYNKVLGISEKEPGWGFIFPYKEDKYGLEAYNLLSVFKDDTDYLKPGTANFMINFRVENLEALVEKIKTLDINVEGPVSEEGCGSFAWIVDPNGIKIELWEQ